MQSKENQMSQNDIIFLVVILLIYILETVYFIYEKSSAQVEIAVELLSRITGMYLGNEITEEDYTERREKVLNNMTTIQKFIYIKKYRRK